MGDPIMMHLKRLSNGRGHTRFGKAVNKASRCVVLKGVKHFVPEMIGWRMFERFNVFLRTGKLEQRALELQGGMEDPVEFIEISILENDVHVSTCELFGIHERGTDLTL